MEAREEIEKVFLIEKLWFNEVAQQQIPLNISLFPLHPYNRTLQFI
jgi:hypothetical protein